MAVSQLEIRSRRPYEDGAAFGQAGRYDRLDGTLHFAVDPTHAANRLIVDLDKAARDGDGRVHFAADFCLLQPADPARANRRLLFDVMNRGRKTAGIFNRGATALEPTERFAPGDGYLFRHGWTLAFCGWQWDVVRMPGLMALDAPQALDGGEPIQGTVAVQFQPDRPCADHALSDRGHRPYTAADLGQSDATLTVRDWLDGPRATLPRERWRFARDEDGSPVASVAHVWLEGGFAAGRIYELIYRTGTCPVVGAGLLAVRDCTAFLRGAGDENPCFGRIDHAYAYGVSQTGRLLRSFLHLGLNVDEAGNRVYDGLLPNVAGAHRGEFNHRFAQPSMQTMRTFTHLPPFAYDEQTDPFTGKTDGLLRRLRAAGAVPRIIATNTSHEYWPGDCVRGDCSLSHTDARGERDLEPPAEVRIYLMAGTQHVSGWLPLMRNSPISEARAANYLNTCDFRPLLRAALVNLDRWASDGSEPPPSVFPRLADGTAVPKETVLGVIGTLPGASVPVPERMLASLQVDLGPQAEQGIGRFPAVTGGRYAALVAAVDADGNETAGIRLPDVAVPVATYTGWNVRNPETGGEGQLMLTFGSTFPLAATAAERRRTGDPRPSIAERYRDRDDYAARYILAEDVDLVVQNALARYDAFAGAAKEAALTAD